MSYKLKLNRLFLLFIIFTNLVSAAQNFPDQFYVEYELTQSSKLVGTMTIEYESKNKNYSFKAVTKGQGILRLFGNRELYSKGIINNKEESYPTFSDWNLKEISNTENPNTKLLKAIKQDYNSRMKNNNLKYEN